MLQSSWLHCCRDVRDGCRVLLAVWLTGEHDGNATTQLRLNLIKPQIHHDLSYTCKNKWSGMIIAVASGVLMSSLTPILKWCLWSQCNCWQTLCTLPSYGGICCTLAFTNISQLLHQASKRGHRPFKNCFTFEWLWIAHKELCTPWSRTC